MNFKAKCKLCNHVTESKSDTDWVSCKCGKLRLIGSRAQFDNLEDMCFIDDQGNEIDGTYAIPPKPTRQELLSILDEMNKRIEELPPQAAVSAITHYDFSALLILLSSIFRAD